MCTTVHLHVMVRVSNKLCKKSNTSQPCRAFQHRVVLRNSEAVSLKCLTEQKVWNVMLCRFRRGMLVEFTIKRRLNNHRLGQSLIAPWLPYIIYYEVVYFVEIKIISVDRRKYSTNFEEDFTPGCPRKELTHQYFMFDLQ